MRNPFIPLTLAAAGAAAAGVVALPAAQASTSYPTTTSMTAPSSVVYSRAAVIRGHLALSGTPFALSPAKLQLRERASSSTAWKVVATKTTDSHGNVAFAIAPKAAVQVDIVHPADSYTTGSTSATRTIGVAYNVSASLSAAKVARGATVHVSVTVAPSASGASVTLQRWNGKAWANVASHALTSTSTWTFPTKAPATAGTYRFRVVKAAGSGYLAGTSRTLALTVA